MHAAGMAENPGLSYGLFHAVAQPVYSWRWCGGWNSPGRISLVVACWMMAVLCTKEIIE